jgi:excisionase family DNA binding protein
MTSARPGMPPRQPDEDRPARDVLDLIDETVAQITDADVSTQLRKALSRAGYRPRHGTLSRLLTALPGTIPQITGQAAGGREAGTGTPASQPPPPAGIAPRPRPWQPAAAPGTAGAAAAVLEAGPLLTPAQVAAMFSVDPKTVTRWAKAGKLTSVRTPGGHRRYREAEVRALLAGIPQTRTD